MHATVVIIGGGQAGLAMSRCLADAGIEHVVIERGKVADRWRRQSWESLHLLTPNWMTRLPGFQYDGDDPDGFMPVGQLIAMLERYAVASSAPVMTDTTVVRVEHVGARFRVTTDRGVWTAESVVIASGYCDLPAVPAASDHLAGAITQLASVEYRRPDQLPAGGVLIVGASSTGVQLADELQRSGREVTIAAGRHTRLPRRYRGRDILWWFDRMGILTETADTIHSLDASRRQPSLQLVGRADHSSLDLRMLHHRGVRIVGRLLDADGSRVSLASDLVATAAAADIKMAEILTRIDRFIADTHAEADWPGRFDPTWPIAVDAPNDIDLLSRGIRTVVWATGCRRAYPWLRVPVLDASGEIIHDGGSTPVPGLFVLGMHFQRRRNSGFIDGVGDDARVIAAQIARLVAHACVA